MGPLGVFLGVAAFAGLVVSMLERRNHPNAVGLSLAQACVWFVGMPLFEVYLPNMAKEVVHVWPVIDVALAVWVAYVWLRDRDGYVLTYLGLLVIQAWLHVTHAAQPADPSLLKLYKAELNISFLAQSLCGAWPGLLNVVGRFHDLLRRNGHRHLPVGHAG